MKTIGKLYFKLRLEDVNQAPTDDEYRRVFHIGKNSFFVLLNCLQIESFFSITESSQKSGRSRKIRDGVILLSIISYYTQYQSLGQCSFRSGINKSSLRLYLNRFIELMIAIRDKIIYLPNVEDLPDLYFFLNGNRYLFPNTKFEVDGSLN